METFAIILAIGGLGNYLNKSGKTNRPQTAPPADISANDKPSGGMNIYEQNRVAQVEKEMLSRAVAKFPAYVKQQFPNDYTKAIGVVPGVSGAPSGGGGAGGFPAPLQALGVVDDSVEAMYAKQRAEWTQKAESHIVAVDPQTAQPTTSVDVFGGPLFRSQTDFKEINGSATQLFEGFKGDTSELSGLPWDGTHANMQPHFKGSNQRRRTDDFAQMQLERFTGADAGQSSYFSKIERPAEWNGPQDTKFVEMNSVSDLESRAKFAASGDRSAYNYMTTTKGTRDAGMDFSKLTAPTKNIDELFPRRGVVEFAGREGGARVSGTRAMVGVSSKEYVPRDYAVKSVVGNRSAINSGIMAPMPEVRDVRSTVVYGENKYQGPAVSQYRQDGLSQASEAFGAGSADIVRRKTDVYAGQMGIATGVGMPRSTGVFNLNVTDKDQENKYLTPAYDGKGTRSREGVVAPDSTIKEMLDVSAHSGAMNRSERTVGGYDQVEFDLPMTNKAMNAENKYLGPAFKNLGGGIRQHGIIALSTLKEMLHHERYGTGSNVRSKEKVNGEIVDGFGEELAVEDYFGNADRIVNRSGENAEEYAAGSTRDLTDKLDFGGYMGGARDSGRGVVCGEASVAEDRTARGRLSVGVQYSSEARPCVEVNLKKEEDHGVNYGNARVGNQTVGHPGILVKTQNMEALNPRLDMDTRITSDLYPWLNCSKNGSEVVDTGLEGVQTVPAVDTDFGASFTPDGDS